MNRQLHSLVISPLGHNSFHPLYVRLCRSRNLPEYFGEEKDVLLLPGTEWRFLGCPALLLVKRLTELSRLCR